MAWMLLSVACTIGIGALVIISIGFRSARAHADWIDEVMSRRTNANADRDGPL